MKQVEVLRDGASAQYGSDAIAGVMNFMLQDDPNARHFAVQYGQSFVGDRDQITASGVFGTRLGDDGFATLALELKDRLSAQPPGRVQRLQLLRWFSSGR